MKEQYILDVERALSLPRAQKKEVVRDLGEIFASALEHGETEQEVIARLGPPEEFAESMAEQLGGGRHRRERRRRLAGVCGFLAAAVWWGAFLYIRLHRVPEEVIGQADGMTALQVSSSLPIDPSWLLAAMGLISLAAAGVFVIRSVQKR